MLGTCSFIYQVTSARRQWGDLFGLRVKLPLVATSLTTQRQRHPFSALPKVTTSELSGLSSHYSSNAERQSAKLENTNFFGLGLTRRGNGIQGFDYESDTPTTRSRAG